MLQLPVRGEDHNIFWIEYQTSSISSVRTSEHGVIQLGLSEDLARLRDLGSRVSLRQLSAE